MAVLQVGPLARQAGAGADDRRADGTPDRRRGGLMAAADGRLPEGFRASLVDQPELIVRNVLHLVLTSFHSESSSAPSSSSTSSSSERPVWVMNTSWRVAPRPVRSASAAIRAAGLSSTTTRPPARTVIEPHSRSA